MIELRLHEATNFSYRKMQVEGSRWWRWDMWCVISDIFLGNLDMRLWYSFRAEHEKVSNSNKSWLLHFWLSKIGGHGLLD